MKYILQEENGGDGGDGGQGGGGDGGKELTSENWLEFVTEDIRKHDSLVKFTDLNALAKGYINAETIIGKDKMVIPKTDDEWNNTYNTLGRPEAADGYELDYGKNEDGTKNEGKDEFSTAFRKTVHDLGLNTKQVSGIHEWYKSIVTSIETQSDSDSKDELLQTELTLKNEWGEKYNGNLALAQRMIKKFGDEDFLNYLSDSKLGNDPRMSRFLISMSAHLGDDNLELGDPGGKAQTNDELKLEIKEVMATNAYTDRADLAHDLTVKKVAQLHERLYAAT